MSDWRDVMAARAQADEYAKVADADLSTNDPGITYATLALAAEVRALATLIDYVHGMDAK